MKMENAQKRIIADEVARLAKKSSQNAVAARAKVSTATISQMVNENWKLIAPDMWRKVSVALHIDQGWKHADTANSKIIEDLLSAAHRRHLAIGISHEAGAGKSHNFQRYVRSTPNTIYIECKNYWTKKSFVRHLLIGAGYRPQGTTEEMIEQFIEIMQKMAQPLIIFDQVDKLKDSQMDLFMDFYNELPHCGFVLSGVPALKKRILRGVQRDKIGYRELYSRIGRKFIKLDPISEQDVQAVCEVNGLTDILSINEIYNTCDGDFRRVRREVEKHFLML